MSTTANSADEQLLSGLENYFNRYAALSPGLPFVLALWTTATYSFETFDCFPYLAITSPTKRCGKTRVAELLELVSANPLRTVGISVAALFRTIEKKKPTLLIDEAESLRDRGERTTALREILNAGYKRGQKVIRCEGGNGGRYQTREFETFCPKVLILIGSLPETLDDRCIPVQMKRRDQELARFRIVRVAAETRPLRKALGEWTKKNRAAVRQWYENNDVSCLEDREAELWLPLFAICAIAAPERLPELEAIAQRLSGVKSASEPGDFGIKLLGDVRVTFTAVGRDRIPTAELLAKLNGIEESPWRGWSQGRGLDGRCLSRLLEPFGIRPHNLREADKVVKGYERDDFQDDWSRYLASAAATSATALPPQQASLNSPSATQQACSASESEEKPNVYAGCSAVADRLEGIADSGLRESDPGASGTTNLLVRFPR